MLHSFKEIWTNTKTWLNTICDGMFKDKHFWLAIICLGFVVYGIILLSLAYMEKEMECVETQYVPQENLNLCVKWSKKYK